MSGTRRIFPVYTRVILSKPPTNSEIELSQLLGCPELPARARAALPTFSPRRIDPGTKRAIQRWRERRNKKRCTKADAAREISELLDRARSRHNVLGRRLATEWARAVSLFEDFVDDEAARQRQAQAERALGLPEMEEPVTRTRHQLAIIASSSACLEDEERNRRLLRARSDHKILLHDIVEDGRAKGLLPEEQPTERNRKPRYRPGVKRELGYWVGEKLPAQRRQSRRGVLRDLLRQPDPNRPVWTDDRPKRWGSR